MKIKELYLKKDDFQPYYPVKITDSEGAAENLSGASINVIITDLSSNTEIANRALTGSEVANLASGEFECRWQGTETATAGAYKIEFKISGVGGDFTMPPPNMGLAKVIIVD